VHKTGKIAWLTLVLVQWLAFTGFAQQQPPPGLKKPPTKTRILFVLDVSGSMVAKLDGGKTRWDVAQEMMIKLVDSLKTQPNLEMALRCYGHQYDDKEKNCEDTKLEVGFAPNNSSRIKSRIQQLKPKGNTPITYSLLQSANDFPKDPYGRNVLVLITDGEESCNQDPCAASLALQKKRVFLKPFIVALGTEQSAAKQFSCIGQYLYAPNADAFKKVMGRVVKQALTKTTVAVVLTDEGGRPVENNVNMTFINTTTNEPQYNFVHYSDAGGRTDTLDVDPILSYDLVINSVPAVYKKDVRIEPGKHNIIKVSVPLGSLQLRQDGVASPTPVLAIIRQNNTRNTIIHQQVGSKEKYLAGKYDLEILTLPRIYRNDVEIKPNDVTVVNVPIPGVLNIPGSQEGFGSLYQMTDSGEQRWIYNFPENNSRINVALQPGFYRVVFRSKTAKSSSYTDVQDFTIRAGATTTLKLFTK
jgi:Ca-activated chloride channel family protein